MVATTVVSETRTVTVELTVTDAPPLKADFVYYEVTGLRLTYVDDELTDLIVIGVASDSGETESLSTRMSAYEMVQPWIRDEVDKHRPSRQQAAKEELAAVEGERDAVALFARSIALLDGSGVTRNATLAVRAMKALDALRVTERCPKRDGGAHRWMRPNDVFGSRCFSCSARRPGS